MVKCADCGYLTVRHYFDRYLAEVEGDIREGENGQRSEELNCVYTRDDPFVLSWRRR